jgi:hypothetical protein
MRALQIEGRKIDGVEERGWGCFMMRACNWREADPGGGERETGLTRRASSSDSVTNLPLLLVGDSAGRSSRALRRFKSLSQNFGDMEVLVCGVGDCWWACKPILSKRCTRHP